MGALVQVPDASLLNQLHTNVPGKEAEDRPNT